ncbi:MAG: hypothetical protein Q9191_006127 [Dirinaria sp. TL-2023a]
MRGAEQYHRYAGLRLSARLTTNLLISCVAANAAVPPQLVDLRSELEHFIDKTDPKWQVSSLVVKYTAVRAAIRDGSLTKSDIVATAIALDVESKSIEQSMPPTWRYIRTYIDVPSERVLEMHFDTYLDHAITQTWNVLRIMRVLLIDIVQTYATECMRDSGEQRAPALDSDPWALRNLSQVSDICASVPQFTIVHPDPVIQGLRCHTLLFPLYVAGLYATAETSIKPWVLQQLRFLATEMGILKATLVADILESGALTSPWDVYVMLGSYATAA